MKQSYSSAAIVLAESWPVDMFQVVRGLLHLAPMGIGGELLAAPSVHFINCFANKNSELEHRTGICGAAQTVLFYGMLFRLHIRKMWTGLVDTGSLPHAYLIVALPG